MSPWTFITRYAAVLSIIAKNPRITALEIAQNVGMTERAVRRVIADLNKDGYIRKKREGRRVRYRVNPDQLLRQDPHRDIAVGGLLKALGWKGARREKEENGKPGIPGQSA